MAFLPDMTFITLTELHFAFKFFNAPRRIVKALRAGSFSGWNGIFRPDFSAEGYVHDFVDLLHLNDAQRIADLLGYVVEVLFVALRQDHRGQPRPMRGQYFHLDPAHR